MVRLDKKNLSLPTFSPPLPAHFSRCLPYIFVCRLLSVLPRSSLSLSLGPTEKTPSSSHLVKPNNLIPLSKRPLLSRPGSWGLVFMTQCVLSLTRIPFCSLASQSKLPLVFLPNTFIPLSSSKCREKKLCQRWEKFLKIGWKVIAFLCIIVIINSLSHTRWEFLICPRSTK